MSSEIPVRQIMRTIVSIDSKSRVKDAARMMVERGIGSLIANRDGLPFGIVTERDLTEKIVARSADPSKVTVAEIMTAPLTTIDAASSINDAARRMVEKQIKRLIVTDQEKIIGIVSQTDLVQSMTDFKKLAKMGMT
ncbi:MAG TPA: CBS domain-containing protein [Candidatus Saccharimonadales bacterium]|jgi:CBS domain-containing protein|nr:CBS domain-containing protein [Candidatus Saccharimonadales bacterium]